MEILYSIKQSKKHAAKHWCVAEMMPIQWHGNGFEDSWTVLEIIPPKILRTWCSFLSLYASISLALYILALAEVWVLMRAFLPTHSVCHILYWAGEQQEKWMNWPDLISSLLWKWYLLITTLISHFRHYYITYFSLLEFWRQRLHPFISGETETTRCGTLHTCKGSVGLGWK